jgi:TRAP-type C4-dicarboxylate transport system permease small subunit
MNTPKRGGTLLDRVVGVFAVVAGILVVYTFCSVCLEVVLRYFFNRPQVWVIETAEYALLFITFLGAAWVLRNEGHVRVDLLINQLRPRAQTGINTVTSIVGAAVCLVLTWYTGQLAFDHLQRGVVSEKMLSFPKGVLLAVIPVGCFLLFIQFLRRTHRYLKSSRADGAKNNAVSRPPTSPSGDENNWNGG